MSPLSPPPPTPKRPTLTSAPLAPTSSPPSTAPVSPDLTLPITLSHAILFLTSPTTLPLLPTTTLQLLRLALSTHLTPKLAPTWDPHSPSSGSAVRSIIAFPGHLPKELAKAAREVGVREDEWARGISETGEWEMWIDPGSVCWRDGGWMWCEEGFEWRTYKQTLHTVWQTPLTIPSTPSNSSNYLTQPSSLPSNRNGSNQSNLAAGNLHAPSTLPPHQRQSHAIPIRAPAVFRIPATPLPLAVEFGGLSLAEDKKEARDELVKGMMERPPSPSAFRSGGALGGKIGVGKSLLPAVEINGLVKKKPVIRNPWADVETTDPSGPRSRSTSYNSNTSGSVDGAGSVGDGKGGKNVIPFDSPGAAFDPSLADKAFGGQFKVPILPSPSSSRNNSPAGAPIRREPLMGVGRVIMPLDNIAGEIDRYGMEMPLAMGGQGLGQPFGMRPSSADSAVVLGQQGYMMKGNVHYGAMGNGGGGSSSSMTNTNSTDATPATTVSPGPASPENKNDEIRMPYVPQTPSASTSSGTVTPGTTSTATPANPHGYTGTPGSVSGAPGPSPLNAAGTGAVRGRAPGPGATGLAVAVQGYDHGNVGVLGGGVKLGGAGAIKTGPGGAAFKSKPVAPSPSQGQEQSSVSSNYSPAPAQVNPNERPTHARSQSASASDSSSQWDSSANQPGGQTGHSERQRTPANPYSSHAPGGSRGPPLTAPGLGMAGRPIKRRRGKPQIRNWTPKAHGAFMGGVGLGPEGLVPSPQATAAQYPVSQAILNGSFSPASMRGIAPPPPGIPNMGMGIGGPQYPPTNWNALIRAGPIAPNPGVPGQPSLPMRTTRSPMMGGSAHWGLAPAFVPGMPSGPE